MLAMAKTYYMRPSRVLTEGILFRNSSLSDEICSQCMHFSGVSRLVGQRVYNLPQQKSEHQAMLVLIGDSESTHTSLT